MYFKKFVDESFIYLLSYVNDMLVACKRKVEIDFLKVQLNQEFDTKDLREAKKILEIKIARDRVKSTIQFTQKVYLNKMLERFGMDDNSKPVSLPFAPHFKLSVSLSPSMEEDRDYMAQVPYASLVGSLMYAMVCTRLDIT